MSKPNAIDLYTSVLRLHRQMIRYSHLNIPRGRGLHHGQGHLLEFIASQDGAIQRDLAEEMDVRPSSMTEMLNRLEQSGWIRREQDENDQRVMRVYLTEEGKKIVEESTGTRNKTANMIFDCLTEEEKAQMAAITSKLSANLETLESKLRDAYRQEIGNRCRHRHSHLHGECGHPFGHSHHSERPFSG